MKIMNIKKLILCAIVSVSTVSADEEVMMMETAKKQNLPQLFTMRTGEILESFSLGFQGAGNITNLDKDGLSGSISIGLGDVAELGYYMEEQMGAELKEVRMSQGHFKLQAIKEGKFWPAVAISAGSSLDHNFTNPDGVDYEMDRNTIEFALSKYFEVGPYRIGVHPVVNIHDDEILKVGDKKYDKFETKSINYFLGLTWQRSKNILFMMEGKMYEGINFSKIDDEEPEMDYTNIAEGNLGVRFYVQTWLFMDAGVRYYKDLDNDLDDIKIHANIAGAIPLKSLWNKTTEWMSK